ncbi:periplasmic solute binding protein [Desulfobulbus propionicus DSM 2032]|jgi:ABC-type Zn uptake system ZnuABC Zn-binding protein ZnuA|uniref:Periplasmic solute binding protein n=1 Tax=Desulfobulbus propionicus (strain ATCC 33891 / DSM 2032 / VKM B-1956 / 1pr3) TaxID=577650 RepID=A0A7U4DMX6_DESPD|nr:zinc ABC transporter substrate-binding protein [Desulfobulbus propionicus]ADW16434.1 periplasmic solute binding protein [Desulfobulbus propionicus DSM 2032]
MLTATLRLLLLLFVCPAALCLSQSKAHAADRPPRILASTFPMYQIVRNITQGIDGVEVELMIPAQMGCPHDYALTPQDMTKLARAEVLVINGLGLEEFLGAPVRKANPHLTLIDSSRGIAQILPYTEEKEGHGHASKTHGQPHGVHNDGHDGHHDANPHLFASPRMAALLTANIANALAQVHPAGAAAYTANAQTYGQRLTRLADELAELGKRLHTNRIVTQHGVFDYLARDMGLEVVAVVQAHAGQDPSASEILRLVQTIKAKKAGAIFTEPQYPEAVGRTIAKEAAIATARLDPAATGPEQAPLDYYEQVMRANLNTLEQTLGSH